MPRDFLFDIGNVILKFDFAPAEQAILGRSTRADDNSLQLIEREKLELESGAIDDATFIANVSEAVGFQGDGNEFGRIWCEIFEENAPMGEVIRLLQSKGHRLYLFSNTSGLHRDYFFEKYPVFASFRGGLYSYSAHSMKPDTGIYEQAIHEFDLAPEETIYIDDNSANVATGLKLGLRSILYDFNRHDDLVHRLAEHGVDLR